MAFEIDSVVRGYHIYKDVWDAHIGTELPCLPESNNREDRYAVAVMDGDLVVGHVPRKISFICNLFLRHSGLMVCRVTGPRQHSTDLVQGGLEVPCKYEFYAEEKSPDDKTFKKVKGLIEKASYTTKFIAIRAKIFQKLDLPKSSSKSVKVEHNALPVDGEDQAESAKTKTTDNPSKRAKLDCNQSLSSMKEWLRRGGIKLVLNDRDSIIRGKRLNDMVINVTQKLLKSQFSKLRVFSLHCCKIRNVQVPLN